MFRPNGEEYFIPRGAFAIQGGHEPLVADEFKAQHPGEGWSFLPRGSWRLSSLRLLATGTLIGFVCGSGFVAMISPHRFDRCLGRMI